MLPSIMTQELPIPGIADKLKNKNDYDGYSYKIFRADMDDLEDMSMLQTILTRGTCGSGEVVILERDKHFFMQSMYLIVGYLEKNPD